jgi:type IV secretory pathway TrbL component
VCAGASTRAEDVAREHMAMNSVVSAGTCADADAREDGVAGTTAEVEACARVVASATVHIVARVDVQTGVSHERGV